MTLDLESAARLLLLHPKTLQARAAAGTIPGRKIGRRWVFVEADLLQFIREGYACHSIRSDESGTQTYRSTADDFEAALGLPTAKRRRNGTTGNGPNSGAKASSVIPFPGDSARQ